MADYSFPISLMRWSYSRLTAFEECRYRFFLKYILCEQDADNYYSRYGSLVHEILADFYRGNITADDCYTRFITSYPAISYGSVKTETKSKYYDEAKNYFRSLQYPLSEEIIEAEKEVKFEIGGKQAIGYIDLLAKDEKGYIIVDHKTRILKRNLLKKTAYNSQFEEYARQLYLYSIATERIYGEPPYKLRFNCFRNGTQVEEIFDKDKQKQTEEWAAGLITDIEKCQDWFPSPEWFKCRTICGFYPICDYAQATFN